MVGDDSPWSQPGGTADPNPKEPSPLEPVFSQCGRRMRGTGRHGRCGRDAGLPPGVHAGHKTPVRPHLCEPRVGAALQEDSPCGLSGSVRWSPKAPGWLAVPRGSAWTDRCLMCEQRWPMASQGSSDVLELLMKVCENRIKSLRFLFFLRKQQ